MYLIVWIVDIFYCEDENKRSQPQGNRAQNGDAGNEIK